MTPSRPTFLISLLLTLGVAQADNRPVADAVIAERTANNGNLVMQGIPPIPDEIVNDLNRYQNVRSASFQEWSADSSSVYVSTRFGDVSQLHRVSMPGGARYQLTFFDEPIGGITRQPGGDRMTFTMDAGGSEFSQIFTLKQDGSTRMISDGESRNGAVLWNHDGNRIAYQSTRRNGASNDIWMMDPDNPESADVAFESPDGTWWGPAAFSPDDSKLLIVNYISVTRSRVLLKDLVSGKVRPLVGGDDPSSVNLPYDFTADGSGFFFTSDEGSEFTRLAHASVDSPDKITWISRDIPWNVTGFVLSDDGKRALFATNAGGLTEYYLMDPNSFEYRRIDALPVGLAFGATFSPDGSRLAMTLNTAQTPSDTFVLELGDDPLSHGRLTRWTHSEVGGLDTESFAEPELVQFPTFDRVDGQTRQIPAFVYRPDTTGNGEKRPVIISIHGGPEGQARPSFNSSYQMWMKKLGAIVIVPNVRGSSGYGKSYVSLDNGFNREDSVKDIGALLDWIETQPDMDKDRVAVIGGSYGGYMVLACGVHYSDRLRAIVDIVGISNFVTFLENTQDYRRDLRRVEYGDERNPAMREFLQKISPLNNVEKIQAPMLVVQGQNDPRVPVTEAEQIVRALRENGQPVWYMNALNEGHGYRKKENRDIYQQAVVLFFSQHL